MKIWKYYILVLVIICGCAPTTQRVKLDNAQVELERQKQIELALETNFESQARLDRISYPILKAAVSYCEDKIAARAGFSFSNKYFFKKKEFSEASVRRYGLGEALQIMNVVPGSPAEEAGIKVGDILISINGELFPVGKKDVNDTLQDLLKKHFKVGQSTTLVVSRNGIEQTIELIPAAACDYPIILAEGDDVNAFADGKKITIYSGMIRFAQDDQELALVIAHELAHNVMGHVSKKMGNYALGSVLDIVAAAYGVNTEGAFGKIASQAYSQEFEYEADYVGLYLMALAGLPTDNAVNFWRRMAATHPSSIPKNHTATHPSTPERFLALEKTTEEIKNKQEQGLPLVPEYKKK